MIGLGLRGLSMSKTLENVLDRGRSLAALGKSSGSPFPYQWSVPGRNARPVMACQSGVLAGVAGTSVLALYTVPTGMRFFMTGYIVEFIGDGWNVGGVDLLMSFVLRGASVQRPLQYLSGLSLPFGSLADGPFPLPAALEFVAFDAITAQFVESGLVPRGGRLVMGVFGYEVPESESFL